MGSNKRTKARTTFRNKITSDELIENINPINKQLMNRYLKNITPKRSPNTIVAYTSDLNIFFCWNELYNNNKSIIDVKKYEIMDFFDFGAMDLKWSPNRFARVHSCLSMFSEWIINIYDEKYPMFRKNVKKIEKLPKAVVRKKSIFKKEELDTLMAWLDERNLPQEQCLLALLMGSGARASELVRFTTTLIDENNTAFEDLFLETTSDMQCKGRGVNGKMQKRYIIKDIFLPYYKKWMPIREEIMKNNNKVHEYIFIKKDGSPAEVATLRSWIEKWDNVLSQHLYLHSLRHFFTTYLLGIGLEKQFVQELQSWSTDTLVDIYNDNTIKDIKWKNLDKLRADIENEILDEEINELSSSDE